MFWLLQCKTFRLDVLRVGHFWNGSIWQKQLQHVVYPRECCYVLRASVVRYCGRFWIHLVVTALSTHRVSWCFYIILIASFCEQPTHPSRPRYLLDIFKISTYLSGVFFFCWTLFFFQNDKKYCKKKFFVQSNPVLPYRWYSSFIFSVS